MMQKSTQDVHIAVAASVPYQEPDVYADIAESALKQMRGWVRTKSGKLVREGHPVLYWVMRRNMDVGNTAALLVTCDKAEARSISGDFNWQPSLHAG